jgi:hypothetical protein
MLSMKMASPFHSQLRLKYNGKMCDRVVALFIGGSSTLLHVQLQEA